VTGRLHVVGAGVAGLAAALAGTRAGFSVSLHEAAPVAGGRCRAVRDRDGSEHDNGTHVLLGANRRALAFLDAVGARDLWVEPERRGLPVVDLAEGTSYRVGLSPFSWIDPRRRPPGLGAAEIALLARIAWTAGRDLTVADAVGRRRILRTLVEPLTVAALNTPVEVASARRLATVLRRLGRPGAGRLFVARRGLGPDMVRPALDALARAGAEIAFGARLKAVEADGTRARALVFPDRPVILGPSDRVVLALPPAALKKLLPRLPVPDAHEPIVNVHYAWEGAGGEKAEDIRFVGVLGGIAQWVLVRPGMVSVTVSAAGTVADRPASVLIPEIWADVRRALGAVSPRAAPLEPPRARVVAERRATIRQAAGPIDLPPRLPLPNLALAGDWLDERVPATIEAAVEAGEHAVDLLRRARQPAPPPRRGPPSDGPAAVEPVRRERAR